MKMDFREMLCFLFLCFILNINGSDAYKCFKKELLQNMTAAFRLYKEPFLTFDTEILTCFKYCKLHSLCKAVNFNRVSFQCQLMSEKPDPLNTIFDFDNILIDMDNWRESFLGACKNHNCPNNTLCRELQGFYNCEVIGCTGFPFVNNINSSSFESKVLWGFGEMVEYACKRGYYPSSNPVCTESGTWSFFNCKVFAVCTDIRKCDSAPEDTDYWLYVATFQSLIKIYCTTNSGGFVSLQRPNFASFSEFKLTGSNCTMSSWENPESKGIGSTDFQKLKIALPEGQIKIHNEAFSNSTLNGRKYGSAKDCYPKDNGCGAIGKFVIDTRGTGFRFPDSLAWKTVGVTPVIEDITRTMNGHVITGFCGGDCGGCKIDETGNGITLELDKNDMPPFESAELPICPFRV